MKKWNSKGKRKSWVGLCLGLSLMGSVTSHATVMVPPNPMDPAGNESTASQGPAAGGGSSTGGSSSSGGTQQSGPGAAAVPVSIETVTTQKAPDIRAQGAVLYNATTGTVLYGKEADTKFYPASITKIMTAMLVLESCNLDDTVTFSDTAVKNLESGSVTLNLTTGDKLTVRQCLYALMLKSANEVANGLGEHVSGSVSAFAAKMNEKAKALGCTNTNFVNPNGLNNQNHYTTPRDMALIAAEAFKNENFRIITSTVSYQIPATKLAGARTVTMGHKMINSAGAQYYPGIIGGKTGYTSLAGNTLVTGAERDGIRLVAVIMKSSQTHYDDTRALLDYGFSMGGAVSEGNRWVKEEGGWRFVKGDGSGAQNQWMKIDGETYWFDSNGYMATGWRQFGGGSWYYFRTGGAMAKNYWVEDGNRWYYLGEDGIMMKNTTTPDGYRVDGNGVWVL